LSEKSSSKAKAGRLDAGWICPQCTLKNFSIVVECEICYGARPDNGYRFVDLLDGEEDDDDDGDAVVIENRDVNGKKRGPDDRRSMTDSRNMMTSARK
jgi:hypothetical protein